jgi:hypothetical protein
MLQQQWIELPRLFAKSLAQAGNGLIRSSSVSLPPENSLWMADAFSFRLAPGSGPVIDEDCPRAGQTVVEVVSAYPQRGLIPPVTQDPVLWSYNLENSASVSAYRGRS